MWRWKRPSLKPQFFEQDPQFGRIDKRKKGIEVTFLWYRLLHAQPNLFRRPAMKVRVDSIPWTVKSTAASISQLSFSKLFRNWHLGHQWLSRYRALNQSNSVSVCLTHTQPDVWCHRTWNLSSWKINIQVDRPRYRNRSPLSLYSSHPKNKWPR